MYLEDAQRRDRLRRGPASAPPRRGQGSLLLPILRRPACPLVCGKRGGGT